jgi:hypothetical protein
MAQQQVHEEFIALAKKIYDETGVVIDTVSFRWDEIIVIGEKADAYINKIEVVSHKLGGQS